MAVIVAGTMLGRVQFRGVRLDVAAMLLLGAAVAHFNITLSPSLGLFGLLLFLYTVGVQAGPGLRNIQRRELKLAVVGVGIMWVLLGCVVLVGTALKVPTFVSLGSFVGLFGSGAGLAMLEGSRDSAASGASAGFAVAAPISSLLVMILVQYWRIRAKDKIQVELEAWNKQLEKEQERTELVELIVENEEFTGTPLRELRPNCQVLWVLRGKRSFPARGDTTLQLGDVLHVNCRRELIAEECARVGRLVVRASHGHEKVVVRKFFVSNSEAINVRLDRLLLRERYDATVTRIRRGGMSLPARPSTTFRWGDRVQVSVPVDKGDELRALFGDDTHGLEEFAFPRAALVIFVGGMLGAVPIQLGGGEALRVGPSLGVLIVSLITAALHRTGPMVWSQSGPTLRLMSHIGLPIFLAQIGNESYAGLQSAWSEYGSLLVVLGIAPVVFLVLLCVLAGRLFRYGSLTVLSLIPSVGMNTPALINIQDNYRERIPSYVYAATYPVVSVLLLLTMFVLSLVV